MRTGKRFFKPSFKVVGILGLSVALLPVAFAFPRKQPKPPIRIELNSAPVVKPQTQPVQSLPGANAPLSVDNPDNIQDYIRYEPYNLIPRDIDLWNLEGKRLIQSKVVAAPDKNAFVYTEVLFTPDTRQTISKLYWVPVTPLPEPPLERLPSEAALNPPPPPVDYATYAARFDPRKTTRIRKAIADVGFDTIKRFGFRTLTITDWSATGKRLLFKERTGILHLGLRTTNILIFDQEKGTVTIYPEVQRIIKYYWQKEGNLPHIEALSWDIQPLGWLPDSDDVVLMKAWAYDQQEKKFLGVWQYNVTEERTELVSLSDDPPEVAANGWLVSPVPPPPQADHSPSLKARIRHPFSYDKSPSATPSRPARDPHQDAAR